MQTTTVNQPVVKTNQEVKTEQQIIIVFNQVHVVPESMSKFEYMKQLRQGL